MCNGGKVVGA